jgi:hypothetical protein
MNTSYKRALTTSIIFGILFLFLTIYFVIIGPNEFLSNKIHFVINSIILAMTMIGYSLLLIFTNRKENIVDERDLFVQKKSYGTGLILSLMYVFIISIVLFITNRDIGTVSVSWLWFIAYSTFAFSYFITSFVIVYYYNRD